MQALIRLCLVLVVGATVAGASARAASPRRPSFVFLYTDDQRWDAMGVVQREMGDRARFPWFETPNMDRLAAEGFRFRNAFVVNSLCSPSRACFLTGRYSHGNGVANNHTPFPADSVTHASLLRGAGYQTAYVGKWHHGSQTGQRPGFDFSASYVGQSRYVDAPFEVNGESRPSTGWVDDVATDYALEFLRSTRKAPDRPFLLCLGFKSPHGPWSPPERLRARFEGSLSRRPPNARALPPFPKPGGAPVPADAGLEVPVNLNYFRVIAGVDENVGRVLATLDELRLAENTLVVYSSDNGYYLGEHGLGDKRSAYEESIRIPLLVRYPGLAGRGKTIDSMALNIDLAPTLLDFAGVRIPSEMQGRSWRPLLEGRSTQWRKAFFYEYFYERNFFTPTVTAVRTESFKLIRYPGREEWTELYDLRADPYETRNLAKEPGFDTLRADADEAYRREAAAVGFVIPPFADEVQPAAAPVRALNNYVLKYDFRADAGDRVVDSSGRGNDGRATGAELVDGRPGRRARRFSGAGKIEVPRSSSLRWERVPWTVEAVVKAEAPDGVVLARGGQTTGFAVFLQGGRPAVAVTVGGSTAQVLADRPLGRDWTHLAAVIGPTEIALFVNGDPAGKAPLSTLPTRDPNETLQIGADEGTPVTRASAGARFRGWIESVRLYSGVLTVEAIRAGRDAG